MNSSLTLTEVQAPWSIYNIAEIHTYLKTVTVHICKTRLKQSDILDCKQDVFG